MGNYVTVDDVKKEGLTSGVDSALVNRRIVKWEAIVEKLTANVFRELDPGELTFDGNDTQILHFNVPLISVSSVKINGESTALESTEYRAYTNKGLPRDDRRNPKITLIGSPSTSLYARSHNVFLAGYDQLITAKWGYVDPDPDNPGQFITPQPIKDAIITLVVRDVKGYFDQYGMGDVAPTVGAVQRERTDDHEIEYARYKEMPWSVVPPDVTEILMMYRSPLRIDVIDPSQGIYGSALNIYGA